MSPSALDADSGESSIAVVDQSAARTVAFAITRIKPGSSRKSRGEVIVVPFVLQRNISYVEPGCTPASVGRICIHNIAAASCMITVGRKSDAELVCDRSGQKPLR